MSTLGSAGEPAPWWRVDWSGGRARWETLKAVFRTSPLLASVVVGCVLVGAALPTLFTLFTGQAVDAVVPAVRDGLSSPAGHRLMTAVAVVGVLFVLDQSLAPIREAVTDVLGRRFRFHIFRRVTQAVLRPATIAHLEDPEIKDRLAKASEIGAIGPRATVLGLAGQWTSRLAGLGGLLIVMAFRWWLGLLLLAALLHEQRRYRESHRQLVAQFFRQAQLLRRSTYLRDVAARPEAAKELRIFGMASWTVDRFRSSWLDAMTVLWRARRGNWRDAVKGTLPVAAVNGLTLLVAVEAVRAGRAEVGTLVVVARALMSAMYLSGISDNDLYVEQGTEVVTSLLELEAVMTDAADALGGDGSADGLPRDGLRFEGVAFRYPGQTGEVFSALDLDIPAGHSLAIVGVNGASKTTIVKLLARLYDPTRGRITVDGVDLRTLDAAAWQRRIAAIFQDFVRYPLPAAANVGFGAVEHMEDRALLEDAAARAAILDAIQGLPAGWDTVLSREWEGGADLSGGQWQRIALARALLAARAGAGVLVLDEPTAHLDVRAEALFYDRFFDLTNGLTTVVISHRFSTVRRADRIVVLEDGRVIESGSHAELLVLGGRYANMFRLQADRFTDDHA